MGSFRLMSITAITLFSTLAIPLWLAAQEQAEKELAGYTVMDLGTLGGTFSFATGINNDGAVSGFSTISGDVDEHAFIWRDGVMNDQGTLGGPNSNVSTWGRRPNERGEVAGAAQTSMPDPAGEDYCAFINTFGFENPAPFQCLPFVWHDGVMTPLPTLGGNGNAAQVNNRGQVAGQVDVGPDPACTPQTPRPVPVLWEKGVLHRLPLVPGFPYAGPSSINNRGGVRWRHGERLCGNGESSGAVGAWTCNFHWQPWRNTVR